MPNVTVWSVPDGVWNLLRKWCGENKLRHADLLTLLSMTISQPKTCRAWLDSLGMGHLHVLTELEVKESRR